MHIVTDGSALTVTFDGLEPLWVLKNKLVIPREQIAEMIWHDDIVIPLRDVLWRMGGTATGTLFAGRFFGRSGKNFLYIRRARGWFGPIRAQQVLEMQLRGNYFARVFLTVDDQVLVQQLLAWQKRKI